MTTERPPDRWLRRRAGEQEAIEISAADAAIIAERSDVVGDLYKDGLVWREPDDTSYSGFIFVTLTPAWDPR